MLSSETFKPTCRVPLKSKRPRQALPESPDRQCDSSLTREGLWKVCLMVQKGGYLRQSTLLP